MRLTWKQTKVMLYHMDNTELEILKELIIMEQNSREQE
jgi:hypothetical protein